MADLDAAIAESPKFAETETGYTLETATFDAVAIPGAGTVTVRVELPSLDAAVVGERVADVVEDGWFDTLERRLSGVEGVTQASVTAPSVERFAESVVVSVEVTPRRGRVVEDVVPVINFIEGTWVGGIVPGYEYVDRVESVRSSAAEMGGTENPSQPRD